MDTDDIGPAPPPTAASGVPRRILVVTADDKSRQIYSSLLEVAGYRVTTAPDTNAALAETALTAPDLVVLQLTGSRPPDLRLCRELRADSGTRDVPVIVLTMHNDAYVREQVVRFGGSAILSEPAKRPHLLRQVRRLLARSRTHPPS